MLSRTSARRSSHPVIRVVNRAIAAIALVNLGLVAFDLSYVSWRDTYLRIDPGFTTWYGAQFKGIEPHRVTESYLDAVDTFVNSGGLNAADADAQLEDLQNRSAEIISENPFEIANKSGTLERIKRRMREEVNVDSSTQAFQEFWSREYLEQEGTANAIAFFNERIRPLMAANYYRGIGENGLPIDRFWLIDRWFVALFAADFLVRTVHLARRYRGTNWFDAVLWRWYDLLFFLPFWRWLRVVPTLVRVDQSGLINLSPVRDRIIHGVITSFAVELTEIVVLRVVEQMQDIIQQGDVVRWMLNPENRRRYVDLNGINEVDAIAQELTNLWVYQTMPKLKPELDALVSHSIDSVLQQAPAYRSLSQLPGIGDGAQRLRDRLISEATSTAYHSVTAALEDEKGRQLTSKLVERLGETLRTELVNDGTLEQLEALLVDLLEEVKVNYVKRIATQDMEQLRHETQHLYALTQGSRLTLQQKPTKP
ncbi:hypothetical protein ACQ4M4_14235 [Leptolyngbya sp. AN02str]|uniref:hypothetical protein n=1 Tax=Leptolyngbya sp. AN02str TaxID=3423363 RepID=UPI003D3106AB